MYPSGLPSDQWLEFYAQRFGAVEINHSFYRLPEAETLGAWGDAVPKDFLFAVKASRYITHMKKLKDAGDAARRFLERVETLGDRLGPVLFQLPARWKSNPGRLREFLAELPGGHRFAFEFRDPTWFEPRVYGVLAEAGAALCIFDLAGETSPKEVTSELVYVRLHGPGKAYQGRYDAQGLAGWAGALPEHVAAPGPERALLLRQRPGRLCGPGCRSAPGDAFRVRARLARAAPSAPQGPLRES